VREKAMAPSTDGGGSSKPLEFSRQKIKIQARPCMLTLILTIIQLLYSSRRTITLSHDAHLFIRTNIRPTKLICLLVAKK
jgi:hypothetical protein